ncbi:hypothetical protein SUDANB19_05123 [Streptomyces sp. enrichment culture]
MELLARGATRRPGHAPARTRLAGRHRAGARTHRQRLRHPPDTGRTAGPLPARCRAGTRRPGLLGARRSPRPDRPGGRAAGRGRLRHRRAPGARRTARLPPLPRPPRPRQPPRHPAHRPVGRRHARQRDRRLHRHAAAHPQRPLGTRHRPGRTRRRRRRPPVASLRRRGAVRPGPRGRTGARPAAAPLDPARTRPGQRRTGHGPAVRPMAGHRDPGRTVDHRRREHRPRHHGAAAPEDPRGGRRGTRHRSGPPRRGDRRLPVAGTLPGPGRPGPRPTRTGATVRPRHRGGRRPGTAGARRATRRAHPALHAPPGVRVPSRPLGGRTFRPRHAPRRAERASDIRHAPRRPRRAPAAHGVCDGPARRPHPAGGVGPAACGTGQLRCAGHHTPRRPRPPRPRPPVKAHRPNPWQPDGPGSPGAWRPCWAGFEGAWWSCGAGGAWCCRPAWAGFAGAWWSCGFRFAGCWPDGAGYPGCWWSGWAGFARA